MHEAAWNFIARAARDITARRLRIVELGSREVNGSVRPIFAGHDYTGVDIAPGPGVDVVADGATYGDDDAYDLAICCETLEHASDPAAIVANMRRIVRSGGLLLITAATDPRRPHSAVDGALLRDNEPYANVQPASLHDWLHECPYVNVEIERGHGDIRAIAMVGGA